MAHKPQFLIGAASSGSGKTTFTLGLLRALRKRGMTVQPFKCGPDYLDTKHHAAAAGRESYNLDTFMAPAACVEEVYRRRGADAQVCITEGVMGLFDGYDNSRGSSAEVAELLGLPVILVMNARSTAYTVAAVLYGFKHFRPEVRIAGAVFNFVGTEAHYAYLKQACRDAGVEALGYLPRCEEIEIPSRHLGLNIGSDFCFEAFADRIAAQVEATVDIDRLLAITDTAFTTKQEEMPAHQGAPLRISVGRDEAFNFMYPENIRALEQYGEITYFSPLRDKALPPSDFVYLPGGYPEFYLEQLSGNEEMRRSVAAYCEGNGLLLAECGGMMYLCESIRDEEGKEYPMCGFLPQTASMEGMKLRLGYRKIVINGKEYRGHEFHYSRILPGETPLGTIGKAYNAKGLSVETPVYRKGRVTAGYTHFYRTGAGHSLLEIAQESEGCNEQDR